jgi:hypothetical protein
MDGGAGRDLSPGAVCHQGPLFGECSKNSERSPKFEQRGKILRAAGCSHRIG